MSHNTEEISSRMFIAFIDIIIRNVIFKLSKNYMDVNKLVVKLSRVSMRLIPVNKYVFTDDMSNSIKEFLQSSGLSCDYFCYLQDFINKSKSGKPAYYYTHADPRDVMREKGSVSAEEISDESALDKVVDS